MSGRVGAQLSPVKENVPNRPTAGAILPQRHPQPMKFQGAPSAPIRESETLDASGFSRAEIHDLEESFKLFDIYGEGSVQVGDLRNILEVLQQEQMQQQQSDNTTTKFPHLETLLYRLSESSDEDTLTKDEYIQLMASTTITNSIAQGNNRDEDNGSDQHFARVFRLFDSGNKGYITVEDLERIAIELGEHDMTIGELQEMIDRARSGGKDGNASDRVGLEEFTRMMTMSLFPSVETGEI